MSMEENLSELHNSMTCRESANELTRHVRMIFEGSLMKSIPLGFQNAWWSNRLVEIDAIDVDDDVDYFSRSKICFSSSRLMYQTSCCLCYCLLLEWSEIDQLPSHKNAMRRFDNSNDFHRIRKEIRFFQRWLYHFAWTSFGNWRYVEI